LGQLKAKLAKLRKELVAPPSGGGGGAGGMQMEILLQFQVEVLTRLDSWF
jgi:ribosome-interacting GTPase 1